MESYDLSTLLLKEVCSIRHVSDMPKTNDRRFSGIYKDLDSVIGLIHKAVLAKVSIWKSFSEISYYITS
ncbi:hypothetical protein IEQ34_022097 [Dendrobium chrysotoxum]|uniref:Uncharacterized protein n=1 Tax=Dendrobium chrysotoxum TaxID=161865 RepID=A0AAV7FY25_DENCH|nr:hypothetical protein IEQ34_022097 [Dendrobium chrysotoxum]